MAPKKRNPSEKDFGNCLTSWVKGEEYQPNLALGLLRASPAVVSM
jgi:hypothetical protein